MDRASSAKPPEEPLGGGGLTSVSRAGATVLRAVGPWTPAVHALLRHLGAVGFAGAPRVLGIDPDGREVLSFVAGEAKARHDDSTLASVARLIRRYHDATSSFREPDDARWQRMVGAPREREVICHNDLSPANTIYGQEGPLAFVDWDLAAPGTRLWDVAYAVWRFVPLYPDDDCVRLGFPVQQRGPRLRLFCEAYGLHDRSKLLDTVRSRQQVLYDSAREWGRAGTPGWAEVWRETRGRQWLRSQHYLDEHRDGWERALR